MLKEISKEELLRKINSHKLWLNGDDGSKLTLIGYNLRGSNLSGSNLSYSDLSYSNLSDSNLSYSNLSYSNLSGSNLSYSNLSGSNLSYSDLRGSNLRGSDLSDSNLSGSNLSASDYGSIQCPEEGAFTAFKKGANNTLIKLLIPEDAQRSSATSRKCRCSKAKVLSITDLCSNTELNSTYSKRDKNFIYTVGNVVEVSNFNENRWDECTSGIHFFITKQEALDY